MSTGLHAAREDLHLPHVPSGQSYLHGGDAPHGMLSKPLSLSPRTFGMEDLRDFCGPLGSFKTGLTPRVFSTGLTPRSGFTPRFTTGFTPRIATSGLTGPDTNSFFSRNTGFSPPRQSDVVSKISPTGFTPKDMSGMKVPMRFPGTFNATPQKMEPQHHHHQQQQQAMSQPMQHKPMHQQQQPQQHHMQHMHQQPQQQQPHHGQHPEMNHMSMMYDYMHHRPTIPQQTIMVPKLPQQSVSPTMSEDGDPEDLDERRRMKNRERVRKCRKRKQDRLNFLEDRTSELEKENGNLKAKLARKSTKFEPLNEAQVKEHRKKQNTTLASYVRAYNESADFAVAANNVWADNAEIVYGSAGTSIAGIDSIIMNKTASAAVFSQYKVKNYTVQWKDSSAEKCLVNWELEVVLKQDAPKNVPLTAPFAELGPHFAAGEVVTVHAISHLTFEEGKIVEEIRQLNLAQMADSILSKFALEAGKASEILRCLMKA